MSKLLSAHIPRVSCLALALCSVLAGGLLFGGLASAALAASATAPASTEAPVLSGTPAVGQTLSCSQGAWANDPSAYTYAWLRDGSPITGQTGSTYTVQSADQGHSLSCQVTAENGGEYTISGLPSGSYAVEFSSGAGAGGGYSYLPQYYGGKASYSEATLVSVIAPGATLGIDAAMSPAPLAGQITGRVTSAVGGAALSSVEVSAEEVTGSGEGHAITNAYGEYTISGLSAGSYNVEFSADGENYLIQSDGGVSVVAGGTTSEVDAAMSPGGLITGRVTAASGGAALANIEVCVTGPAGGGGCTTTNAGGEYTISGLSTNSYDVKFSPGRHEDGNYAPQYYSGRSSYSEATPVSVTAGSTTSGIDAEMQSGGEIAGRVTAASGGAPLANISVCAYAYDRQPLPDTHSIECAVDTMTRTNAGGEYTVSGLSTGSYGVEFFRPDENYLTQYYDGVSSWSEAEAVSVTVGSTTSAIDAEMQVGGRITGRVTAAVGGAALAGIEVCPEESPPSPGFDAYACTTTNANGEYTISDSVLWLLRRAVLCRRREPQLPESLV